MVSNTNKDDEGFLCISSQMYWSQLFKQKEATQYINNFFK